MKRWTVLALTATALAVALPPSGFGKGELVPGSVLLCGPSDCTALLEAEALELLQGTLFAYGEPISGTRRAPPPISPFYELRLPEELGRGASFLVADAGVARWRSPATGRDTWFALSPRLATLLREAVRGREPFPAPTVTSVELDTTPVSEPAPYRAVYEPFPSVPPSPRELADRLYITLASERPSPWTDGRNEVYYVPGLRVLNRDGEWVRPSDDLVRLIEEDAGLGAKPGGGFPWALVGGLVGGAALLLGALASRRARAGRVRWA